MIKYTYVNDFSKERYNTYAKLCNSKLYTKYPSTLSPISGYFSEQCVLYNVNSYQTMHL